MRHVEMEELLEDKPVMMEIHIIMMVVHQHVLRKLVIDVMEDLHFVGLYVEMGLLPATSNVMIEIKKVVTVVLLTVRSNLDRSVEDNHQFAGIEIIYS